MARDYKNTGQRKKTTPAKKTPAKQGAPGWLWLVTGLLMGGFGVFLYNLSQQPKTVVQQPAPTTQTPPKTHTQTPEKEKVEFTFYDRLKHMEVVIPDEELDAEIKQSDQSLSNPTIPKGQWALQAGAFYQHEDADRQKARIVLLGVEANIERTEKDGKPLFRVKVGPSNDLRELNTLRERLKQNQIQTFVVRIK